MGRTSPCSADLAGREEETAWEGSRCSELFSKSCAQVVGVLEPKSKESRVSQERVSATSPSDWLGAAGK